jgi:hypothetical protein
MQEVSNRIRARQNSKHLRREGQKEIKRQLASWEEEVLAKLMEWERDEAQEHESDLVLERLRHRLDTTCSHSTVDIQEAVHASL